MFKVGDQVHIRGEWKSPTFDYTYDTEKDRSVEVGTVVEVSKWPITHIPYLVKFWSQPDKTHMCSAECLVRADVQAG